MENWEINSNTQSSSEENNELSSSDESLHDLTKLKPYDLEPIYSDVASSSSDSERVDSEEEEQSRIGNTSWCECGNCRAMKTYTESYCCRDTNEIPDEYFEGRQTCEMMIHTEENNNLK